MTHSTTDQCEGDRASQDSAPSTSVRRKTAGNVASNVMNNLFNRGTMFVVYVIVARHLGTDNFGQLALASALLYSWHECALAGLKTLVTREVARERSATASYFLHASAVGLVTSGAGIALMVPVVGILGYGMETREVIYLLFLGLAPLVLSQICEGIFQGWERMDCVVLVNAPVCMTKILAVFLVVKLDFGIRGVALSLSILQCIAMVAQWLALARLAGLPRVAFQITTAIAMVRASSVFFGIQAVNSFKTSVVVIILSKWAGEAAVGLYAAAVQLLAPFSMLLNGVAFALFPAMCRGYDKSIKSMSTVVLQVIEGMMFFTLPAVTGLFILADRILILLYQDNQFLVSATVLRIVVWSLLASVMTSIIGQSLWASSRETLAFRISVANLLAQVIISIILISLFGVAGAAISALVTSVINLVQHILPTAKMLSKSSLFSVMLKPLVASGVMALFVAFARDLNLAIVVAGGMLVYAVVLTGLLVWEAGGLRQFRASCNSLWTT